MLVNKSKRMQCKITSLDRGLRILSILAAEKDGLGVTELSRRLDADKSVVYRTLSSLMMHTFVEQEPVTKKYALGLKVMELASKRLRNIDLFSTSKPFLKDLARQTGEVVVLAVMIGDVLAYLDREEGVGAIDLTGGLGQPVPLHSTACGKSILAFLPEDDLVRIFRDKGLPAITEKTITSFSAFKIHLAEVRLRGYAIDDEETYHGVRCIAAPIRNHSNAVVASLSLSSSTQRITPANLTVFADLVRETAAQISARLGYGDAVEATRSKREASVVNL
ncbi:MAG: IclR family transcriptional regulator [Acidimicrobiia bacterium]|nr:IclR family transcriptional regulator [Acidimicrobiia bacterium]